MNLNSGDFFLFFAAVFIFLRLAVARRRWVLLFASYLFYATWNWFFLPLLWFTTAVDFFAAKKIQESHDLSLRKRFLWLSLAANLGLLFVFKYAIPLGNTAFETLGLDSRLIAPVIPIGLSFHTFQSMGYVLDVYRRKIRATGSLLDYANFVSFFPQLIAGPIERAAQLIPQLAPPARFLPTADQVYRAGYLILLGLLMSLGLGENIAKYAAPVQKGMQANWFNAGYVPTQIDFIFSFYAYPFLLYLRFAGYSFLAMGFAQLIGVELTTNFRFPFYSRSMAEFWGRWHISLSKWIRDYIFFPLTQNMRSDAGIYACIYLTMLVFGLWHEASLGWVVAALILGTYSVVGHAFVPKRGLNLWRMILTFHVFAFAMVFVNNVGANAALPSWSGSLEQVGRLQFAAGLEPHHFEILKVIAVTLLIDGINFWKNDIYGILRLRMPMRILAISGMVLYLYFNRAPESGLSLYFRM